MHKEREAQSSHSCVLKRMSCRICLPYFPIGSGWPNMPLMMKGDLGTPVFSSKHPLMYWKKWRLENIWGHLVFCRNSEWAMINELLYSVTCVKCMRVSYMWICLDCCVPLCPLGRLMLYIYIPLPSEGKLYISNVRCSGSQDLGHFCRAPISTMNKQSAPKKHGPEAQQDAEGHWHGWKVPQLLHGSDRLAWGELTSVNSVERHRWSYLRTFGEVLSMHNNSASLKA